VVDVFSRYIVGWRVELAWQLVLTPEITYMKFKYDKRNGSISL
jgi:hypothetical protein